MGSFFRQPFLAREKSARNLSIRNKKTGADGSLPEGGLLRAPKTVAVAALSPGAGASFVSGLLADGLCALGSVCLLEPGAPHFYDALGIEKRFALRGFVPYFEKLRAGEAIREIGNLDGGIRYFLRLDADDAPLSASEAFRLLALPRCDYNIFDCSRMEDALLGDLLAQADAAVLVIDPLPSRLLPRASRLERLRLALPDARLVVNKMNPGVQRAELSRFLGLRAAEIPALDAALVYRAEYDCVFCSRLAEGRRALRDTQDILTKIFQ